MSRYSISLIFMTVYLGCIAPFHLAFYLALRMTSDRQSFWHWICCGGHLSMFLHSIQDYNALSLVTIYYNSCTPSVCTYTRKRLGPTCSFLGFGSCPHWAGAWRRREEEEKRKGRRSSHPHCWNMGKKPLDVYFDPSNVLCQGLCPGKVKLMRSKVPLALLSNPRIKVKGNWHANFTPHFCTRSRYSSVKRSEKKHWDSSDLFLQGCQRKIFQKKTCSTNILLKHCQVSALSPNKPESTVSSLP